MNNTIEKKEKKLQNETKVNEQINENKTIKIVIKVLVTLILIITLLILLSIILNEELLHLGEGIYNNIINNTISGTVDNANNNVINTVKPSDTDIKDDYVLNYLFVVSEGNKWGTEQEINVFNNEFYSDNIIAPGVCGKYDFTVENTGHKLVTYNLDLEEINDKNINLQYKVKMNGEYILEQWTRVEDISLSTFQLQPYTNAEYIFEWEWIDAENDTIIGEDAENTMYKIKIKINAQTTSF